MTDDQPEPTPTAGDPPRGADVFLDLTKAKLAFQLDSASILVQRLGSLFGYAVSLVALASALIGLRRPIGHGAVRWLDLAGGVVVAAGFLAVAYIVVREIVPKHYQTGPQSDAVWQDLWTNGEDADVLWQVAYSYRDAVQVNEAAHERRIASTRLAIALVIVQTIGLAIVVAGVIVGAT